MSLSPDPSTLPTREAVHATLIRRDLDRFIRRHLLTSVPNPIPSIGGGIALIMVSMGSLNLLDGLWTTGIQTVLAGLVVGILSIGIPLLVAVTTRSSGLWDKPVRDTVKAYAIAYLHLPNPYSTPDYLTPVVNLLSLVATAPTYIAEAERYAYWDDTLQEARSYLEATKTLALVKAERDTAEVHLNHLRAGTPPAPAPRKWSLLPAPPAPQDPLLIRAETRLAEAEMRCDTVKTYLASLQERLCTRERHLRYAIAATETFLSESADPVVLTALEPIDPLPHAEAMRLLLA